MEEPKILNIVKFYTICLLSEGPKYGYEVIKTIGDKIGKNVSPGQIYPFFSLLEKQKYVNSKVVGERDKKIYSLTKDGKEFTAKMLKRFGDLIDIAIEPRLTVCAHCGCEIYKGGHKEKIDGKEMAFCCRHCAKSFKK